MLTESKLLKIYPKLKEEWKKVNNRGNYQKINERLCNGMKQINKLGKNQSVNVLDIGCNNGILSVVASKLFNKVIGIDNDDRGKEVIKKARITAKFFGKKNCVFYKMSFFDYYDKEIFARDNIKAIMGFQVLYHLNDLEVSMLRIACNQLQLAIVSVRPEVGDRVEPGKPANKLGLYTIEQTVDFFSPFFDKIRIKNKNTRWPTLIMRK